MRFFSKLLLCITFLFAALHYSSKAQNIAPRQASANLRVIRWKKEQDGLSVITTGGTLKVTPFLKKVVRIQFGGDSALRSAVSYAVKRTPATIAYTLNKNKNSLVLKTANYSVKIAMLTSQVKIFGKKGNLLIEESPFSMRNAGNSENPSVSDIFHLHKNDAIYGLGQFRDGAMNLRGRTRELVQVNSQVALPVLYSNNGWGIFWDNPSRTVFKDNGNGMSFSSDYGNIISYYIFTGGNMDNLIGEYRVLTGQAPMLPDWAYGYHQSRNKYATQQEVLSVARRMRKEKIPVSSIFIDYYYWGKYGTGSNHFDEHLFPDVKGMISTLHDSLHIKLIVTVWPAFKPGSANYDTMNSKGYLLNNVRVLDGIAYDPFNPKAAAQYWKQVATQLVPLHIDGWFLDGPEPDNVNAFLKADTCDGPAAKVRDIYPLMHTTNFYNGLLSIDTNKRPYIITRSAWVSQQKNGTVIWSGDIGTTFNELKKQITAGLNFTATGIPYWTTDIGGYSGGNPRDTAYQELYVRWWQYGAFCPIFRSHGKRYPGNGKGPNELWAFGPYVQKICTAYDSLRYRLLPYIYTLAGMTTLNGYTPMRLLAFDFPADTAVLNIKDEFMYGPAFLVCPVTEAGAKSRSVYLPGNIRWIDFWSGRMLNGGETLTAAAPIDKIPLFIKCGSIIPFGPAEQYTGQVKTDTLDLKVYPGADGRFNLYEDDGTSYNYKHGQYSIIPITWSDKTKTLTIGKRYGKFAGMLQKRILRVSLIGFYNKKNAAPGIIKIAYSGKAVKRSL